jgi:RNA polymerase sigma-70 factor, ECF subfamily
VLREPTIRPGGTLLSLNEESDFWTFYQKTSEALFRKAYRMCRGRKAVAEDAHQETYIKALKHWSTISGLTDQQRYAWLVTTLTREVLQIWRKEQRLEETNEYDDTGWQAGTPAEADDTDALLFTERYRTVCRAIATLGGRQHQVLALYGLAGYEIHEIAEMLEIKPQTVRVHLHAGRQRLREILDEQEGSA